MHSNNYWVHLQNIFHEFWWYMSGGLQYPEIKKLFKFSPWEIRRGEVRLPMIVKFNSILSCKFYDWFAHHHYRYCSNSITLFTTVNLLGQGLLTSSSLGKSSQEKRRKIAEENPLENLQYSRQMLNKTFLLKIVLCLKMCSNELSPVIKDNTGVWGWWTGSRRPSDYTWHTASPSEYSRARYRWERAREQQQSLLAGSCPLSRHHSRCNCSWNYHQRSVQQHLGRRFSAATMTYLWQWGVTMTSHDKNSLS